MKLYSDFQSVNLNSASKVGTIGMFDSIHLGHQSVLRAVKKISEQNQLESFVITFSNSPSIYFQEDSTNEFIFPILDKIKQIESIGIDHLIILPFDHFIASLNAKVFIEELLINRLNTSHLVLGYDNHFGKGREGSVDYINSNFSHLINAYLIDAVEIDNQIVSSSLIKQNLKIGNFTSIKQYLGRNYYLTGVVVKGKQLGRQIGFKTANIQFDENLYIPAFGVYAVTISINNLIFNGVCNFGIRPTINDGNLVNVEVHIFNFDEEIYGQEIRIEFISKIREEKRFNSLDELKNQISIDIIDAKKMLT